MKKYFLLFTVAFKTCLLAASSSSYGEETTVVAGSSSSHRKEPTSNESIEKNSERIIIKEVVLPTPTGVYGVGSKTFNCRDHSPSGASDSTQWEWLVQAYYPSEKDGGIYPYRPERFKNGIFHYRRIWAHIKVNATLLKHTKFPVIIFIPNYHVRYYNILYEELASHGYVILYSTETNTIKYLLDNIDEINQLAFGGCLNTGKITLIGHGHGGEIAYTLGFANERVKAVVAIDALISSYGSNEGCDVPSNPKGKPAFFIRGTLQRHETVDKQFTKDQLTKIQNAKVWEPAVEHNAFADDAYLIKQIPPTELLPRRTVISFWNWVHKYVPCGSFFYFLIYGDAGVMSNSFFDDLESGTGKQRVNEWFDDYRARMVDWLNREVKDSQ